MATSVAAERPTSLWMRCASLSALVLAATAAASTSIEARQQQGLGPFRWQLAPFCNVITVTLVPQGAQYLVDGTDDLCGASRLASVVGRAFPNPDGSIGFGLTTVTTTAAAPIHVDARIDLGSLGGPWGDSAGNAGQFVFTPGPGVPGAPRPIPPGGIAAGVITGAQLAPGSVGAAQLAPGAITTPLVAAALAGLGSCPSGQFLRGIQPDGSLLCDVLAAPPTLSLVDAGNQSGHYLALAIGADGFPVVSHMDGDNFNLRLSHCTTVACTSAATVIADAAGPNGQYSSVAIGSDGLPFISHYHVGANSLKTTHCNDLACTTATSTLHINHQGGQWTSVAIGADKLPIVAHHGTRVTHCNNLACTAETSTDLPIGVQPHIAIGSDGLAIISGYSGGDLVVTHCANVTCTAATTTAIDTANDVGAYSSIAIGRDGRAIIAYKDSTSGDLRVSHCTNVACTSATSTTVDAPNDVGYFTSIAIGSDGLPVISHYDQTRGDLRVTHCSTAVCSAATSVAADTFGDVGRYSSIAIGIDGLPVVAHRDASNGAVRVTKCASVTCQ